MIMYYRKSSLERALSMPDSSTPRSIKSITWMSIIDPSSYPQTQPHIQVLLKFEWILFKILRILTTWTAASQASQARSLSSGETLETWIFFSGKDIQYTFINLNGCSCRLQTTQLHSRSKTQSNHSNYPKSPTSLIFDQFTQITPNHPNQP